MVKLFHHYETQSNRIFLLVEHVNGDRLVAHVSSIRSCYLKVAKGVVVDRAMSQADKAVEKIIDKVPVSSNTSQEGDENDRHIENLLEQLTSIVPPSNPVTASLSTISADSEEDEEDKISVLRNHLKQNSEDDLEEDELDYLKKQLAELAPVKSEHKIDEVERHETKEDSEGGAEDDSCPDVMSTPCEDASEDEEDTVLSDLRKQLLEFTTMPVVNDESSYSEIEESKSAVQNTADVSTSVEDTTDPKLDTGSVSKLDSDDVCSAEKEDLIKICDPNLSSNNIRVFL